MQFFFILWSFAKTFINFPESNGCDFKFIFVLEGLKFASMQT